MQAVVACTESGSLFPVDSATVTVNGEDVPPSFLGNISFTLTPVAPAADVTMHFSFEDVDILKTLVMPTKPPAVTNNRQTLVTSPITISWGTITPTPDNVEVSVSFNTQSGDPFSAVLPGDTTTYDIPANTLIASSSITVMVAALNSTTNLGSSVMAGSIYQVGNQGVVSFPSTP
jgi:hypothetical protein